MRSGCGGSRRAPWEGKVWRAAPLPATPVCAEQLAEGRLLLSTTSNTYILEGIGIGLLHLNLPEFEYP